MDTHKKIREHISAFADGASPEADVELALAALQGDDGRQTWGLYHLIGDVLRVKAGPPLAPGFNEKLAARLALEPLTVRKAVNLAATPVDGVIVSPAASA